MASTDARPHPLKTTAYRRYFAVRKNDGTLITSWAGAASEVSLDGAPFMGTTHTATEIGAAGIGYLDLTAAEMTADAVVLKVTVTNTAALPVVFTFFPEETTDRAPLVSETQSGLATAAALATVDDFLDTEMAAILADTAAIKAKTDLLPAAPAGTGDIPSADSIADAWLDRADGIETALTPRQTLRLVAAALAGKLAGAATTTVTIRNVGDTKDRITALVDADGNRTAVTTDVS